MIELLVYTGILALIIIVSVFLGRKRDRILKRFAQRIGGRLCKGGPGDGEHILYRVGKTYAKLFWFSGSSGGAAFGETLPARSPQDPWTALRFQWLPPGWLRVAPESFLGKVGKAFGKKDIQIGDALFDKRFLIRGKPEKWVHRVLGEGTRRLLLRLQGLLTSWSPNKKRVAVYLDVTRAGMTLRVENCLVNGRLGRLKEFMRIGEEVFKLISACGSKGLEIEDLEVASSEGTCQVCGDSLSEGTTRVCPECKTPHHKDCWEYNQGCSTFACDSRD